MTKPIMFSGPMVRALIAGRKTQTRRVLKPQPEKVPRIHHTGELDLHGVKLPYQVRDLLWVREVWRTACNLDPMSPAQIVARCLDAGYRKAWAPIQYEADGARDNWIADPHTFEAEPGRHRVGIHMPRQFSRLTLRVTDVRVQLVQEISGQDANAEGMQSSLVGTDIIGPSGSYRDNFRILWDSLNAARGFGWDANPWVAAYTFKVIRKNVDDVANDR